MSGVKGRSGTNKGKDKPWAEALRMVGYRDERKKLLAIAEQCFSAAEAGDIQAMKEIGDRLDGKPAQAIEVTDENRDIRDLNSSELAARVASALARLEVIAGGDTGQGTSENGPSDIRKLN